MLEDTWRCMLAQVASMVPRILLIVLVWGVLFLVGAGLLAPVSYLAAHKELSLAAALQYTTVIVSLGLTAGLWFAFQAAPLAGKNRE